MEGVVKFNLHFYVSVPSTCRLIIPTTPKYRQVILFDPLNNDVLLFLPKWWSVMTSSLHVIFVKRAVKVPAPLVHWSWILKLLWIKLLACIARLRPCLVSKLFLVRSSVALSFVCNTYCSIIDSPCSFKFNKALFSFPPKNFYPSHRIFGHMYGILNVDKK